MTERKIGHLPFSGKDLLLILLLPIPFVIVLAEILAEATLRLNLSDVNLHRGGTYVCMEGPAFSTSKLNLISTAVSATVIGMTNLPEAKLAREAEIAYATLF